MEELSLRDGDINVVLSCRLCYRYVHDCRRKLKRFFAFGIGSLVYIHVLFSHMLHHYSVCSFLRGLNLYPLRNTFWSFFNLQIVVLMIALPS